MSFANPKAIAASDRRSFGRRTAMWHAWVITGTKQRFPCRVVNISSGGALLELEVTPALPPRFDLALEGTDIVIKCDVRHRGEHGIGVSFTDAAAGERFAAVASQGNRRAQTATPPARPPAATPAASHRPRLDPLLIAEALRAKV